MSGEAVRDGGEPLHRFKAGLFKALGHPLRLRMLELLRHGEMSVRDLLRELDVEPSTASQQLGILRAQGVVESWRRDGAVFYRIRDPLIGELLDVGRRVFASQASEMQHVLDADARRSAARPSRGRRPGARRPTTRS
ncbi:MAG TPA: metalloregulator ArsR/SmtB family transcription factor [Candidatus Limnocylindria bacterium]|nr:metalloregulator ArsR/SmtB family transcription factor [Candidatus Limnocylindria bacterium]